jgi:hypothetical protein
MAKQPTSAPQQRLLSLSSRYKALPLLEMPRKQRKNLKYERFLLQVLPELAIRTEVYPSGKVPLQERGIGDLRGVLKCLTDPFFHANMLFPLQDMALQAVPQHVLHCLCMACPLCMLR